MGIGITRDIQPEEVGTMVQVARGRQGGRNEALKDAGIDDPREVHYVQVKGPLLTPATIRMPTGVA